MLVAINKNYLLSSLPVYDFVVMQVVHSVRNLVCPLGDQVGFDLFLFVQQNVGQWAFAAELHHNAIARGNRADAQKIDYILVLQLFEVLNFGFRFFAHLLYGDHPIAQIAFEHNTLRAGVDPLQISNTVERNLPGVLLHLALADRIPNWHQTTEHSVEPSAFGTRTGLRGYQILIVEKLLQIADIPETAQATQIAEVAQIA